MADEIENARPKGLLIPFDKLKLLDILDDAAFRQVFRAMAAYVKTGTETTNSSRQLLQAPLPQSSLDDQSGGAHHQSESGDALSPAGLSQRDSGSSFL